MSLNEKVKFGNAQILSGAKQLQNYMQSVSESLTSIEKALNHNTLEIGKFLKEIASRQEKIMKKLGLDIEENGPKN